MPDNSYQQTLDWLFSRFPAYHKIGEKAYKPTLENTLKLAGFIGNPQGKISCIHIAGTNGKGSTSSMLASILQEAGEKVGLFTSPHIEDFRERIRVNGVMIPEKEVIDFCVRMQEATIDIEPSFFEITWVMAMDYFAKNNCSVCVVETGLGGRLDATNIIDPLLSVITNIGLEHTKFLGNTLEEIAGEKAGIIKPFRPVIIGETLPETKIVFLNKAAECNAEIIFSEDFNYQIPDYFPLKGSYQELNYRTVRVVLNVLKSQGRIVSEFAIKEGIKKLLTNTGFRGRMQVIKKEPLTIVDVSHNYDGIKATLTSIREDVKGRLYIIYGTSSDKDIDQIMGLFPRDAHYYLTEFRNERSASLELLVDKAAGLGLNFEKFKNSQEAYLKVQSIANKEDTILVFGSFFLIEEFF